MLKSRVVAKEGMPQSREFPRMMRSNMSDIVVLFVGEGKGMVVLEDATSDFKLGHYAADWQMRCFDEVENFAVVLEQ